MSNPNVLELAKAFLPEIRKMMDTEMAKLGAPADLGAKVKSGDATENEVAAYCKVSNTVLKAVMTAAMQRAMDDGASRGNVGKRLGTSNGWDLFLERHPDIAAKVKAESEAKAAKYAAMADSEEDQPDLDDCDGSQDDE